MTSPLLGEFLGTMILIVLGDGAVAAVLLKRSKAEGSGWIVITAGWAFAVMAGVFTAIACGSSDAHLNPAVTIGFAMRDSNFANSCHISLRSCLARLPAARWSGFTIFRTGRDARCGDEAWLLLHRARDSQVSPEPNQ